MFSSIVLFVLSIATSNARGPLCLDCAAVRSPDECTRVTECGQNEKCVGVHFLWANRQNGFSFGCRSAERCFDKSNVVKRLDFHLCDSCCEGDLCNNDICTNGTAPPPGIPCLLCPGLTSASGCTNLKYCREGEVCFTEQSVSRPVTFNLGCAPKVACDFENHEIIGKRSASQEGGQAPCHECCSEPGCNHGACTYTDTTTTQNVHHTSTEIPLAHSCWEIKSRYNTSLTGWYNIISPNGNVTRVYCDMTTDGGGWMVVQRRVDGSVDFNRDYITYSRGFGNDSEFWFGNENLHTWSNGTRPLSLRVDFCDWANSAQYATYKTFAVGSYLDHYRIYVTEYTGNAGDAFITGDPYGISNGQQFSAPPDSDHDQHSGNCAFDYASGWWFNACYLANLNGRYLKSWTGSERGVEWRPFREYYSLKTTEMKLRPADASPTNHGPFTCP